MEDQATTALLDGDRIFAFQEAALWVDVRHLQVDAGAYTLAVEFETAESGAVRAAERTEVVIPDFGAGGLALSDLLPAYHVEEALDRPLPGRIRRGGLSILPAPWGVFAAGAPLHLYFEVYNLAAADGMPAPYAVEAALVEQAEGARLERRIERALRRGRGVSVRFEAEAAGPDDVQHLVLDTDRAEPGAYVLAVRVTDGRGGAVAEARRVLVLE